MMTIEAWLGLAASATVLLLAPHPLVALIVAFSRSRGRGSAFLTVPATILALLPAAVIAAAVSSAAAFYASGWSIALSWPAVGYLMIYLLYAWQDPRFRHGAADNDNLPETRVLRILGFFARQGFPNLRYIALMTAILLAIVPARSAGSELYAATLGALAAAATLSALIYAVFPNRLLRPRRRSAAAGQALHKPRTLFIASRAVKAGYRRIAA